MTPPPSSIKILKSTLLLVGMFLAGCNEGALVEESEVKTRPLQVSGVLITPDTETLPVNSTLTFDVVAETEALFDIAAPNNKSRVNISALSELTLESSDPEILYIPKTELTGLARKKGTVTVYAHFRGVQSEPLTIEVLPELTSCGEVNSTDKNTPGGACLKVIKGTLGEAENKYFTATPSIRFLNALNYSQENNSVSTGKAFSTRFLGRGKYATRHEHFVNFRQDGRYSLPDGSGGQYDRYCKNLAQLNFLGKNDWRRATEKELSALGEQGDLFAQFGFVNNIVYWTSTRSLAEPSKFYRVGLVNGRSGLVHKSGVSLGASCVSSKP
ncbi:DUF1566 domain-containing protein [Vibrio sp. L3-7]|uniref:DUF1566 domain-containing protein n=1 Tax=Vibrio sp. L3-7 TaxID=2912253 RepID=UPI001F3DD844|nr:DUF1566 domain-containing protein [Vibrio sp. L3-7]MCF7507268.1 DUF1566 domain-containing protein [Vibrio sp. L3-7]